MMNRSTQKELIKLMVQLNEMWPQLDLSNPEQQNMVLDILNTISTDCQKDFSKANAGRYADTLDSLGQVIKMTDWQHMGREELAQCVSLCQDIILQVVNNLRNEKELKKDIVFLPYKASMWDSLESVWKAANEDKEHCNTYVIPIPYCDRNPDGTAKEWHCEREFFPADVPTLNWQDVDLKQMHPDVIFFHYPYDDCNYVTSVDAAYYSRNLKQCTDKLIYIPYFVLQEPKFDYDNLEQEDKIREAEDKLSNFILEPGVMNAHQSVVQSEAMKRVYVNVLTRYTNVPREYWEKHILGLGSPKFDKVANSSREDYELPEEWQRIIRGRKTVLYNTGLSTMLKYKDTYLDKVRSVLQIFKGQDDVVLWWRPHPLLRATFQSMNSDLLTEYDEIVSRYRQEGWGIYDDTAELERAVAWTDGYYGDGSSVVQLYEKTGKMVMIQYIADK